MPTAESSTAYSALRTVSPATTGETRSNERRSTPSSGANITVRLSTINSVRSSVSSLVRTKNRSSPSSWTVAASSPRRTSSSRMSS